MRNLHKYYFKEYYSGNIYWLDIKSDSNKTLIEGKNKEICAPLHNYKNPIDKSPLVNKEIPLKVQYPGLVTGIGIKHEIKVDGEFKLGMHFDWTYGVPIVYGSSVKGVLRSWFKEFYKPTVTQPSIYDAFNDIFEGKDAQGHNKSIYKRDIFFDAVIDKTDSKGRILCPDSITPHGDDPLKNPNPLGFVKIAPGCTLQFQFKLFDTEVGDKKLTASEKEALFEEILTTVGIGAKTNVGYGQLK